MHRNPVKRGLVSAAEEDFVSGSIATRACKKRKDGAPAPGNVPSVPTFSDCPAVCTMPPPVPRKEREERGTPMRVRMGHPPYHGGTETRRDFSGAGILVLRLSLQRDEDFVSSTGGVIGNSSLSAASLPALAKNARTGHPHQTKDGPPGRAGEYARSSG
jgi:hypothetical protein